MDNIIEKVAARVRETRLTCEISEEEMAQLVAEADALIKEYKETHEGWL